MIMSILLTMVVMLLTVAFFTVFESKLMASVQRSVGPGFYSKFYGVGQGIFDGVKLLFTEMVLPKSYMVGFMLAPVLNFVFSFLSWFVLLPATNMFFKELGSFGSYSYDLFIMLGFGSFGVFSILLAGIFSNNKFALYGALSAVIQMMSYELILLLTILPMLAVVGSGTLMDILNVQNLCHISFGWPFFSLSIIFFMCSLAETNSAPFDLAESESELVAGFHVEYGGFLFALFFLAEYSNMLMMCFLNVMLFWGNCMICSYEIVNFSIFLMKVLFFVYLFVLVRAGLPSYRFDSLMILCWKVLFAYLLGFNFLFISMSYVF